MTTLSQRPSNLTVRNRRHLVHQRRWLPLFFLGFLGIACAQLQEAKLANGFAYSLLPTGDAAISLRFVVRTGPREELPEQQGFSHFVEHLAFRGGPRFSAAEVDQFLRLIGGRIGPDLNARTNFSATIYSVDLPDNNPTTLARALDFLRYAVVEMTPTPATVETERNVILRELAEFQTPNNLISMQSRAAVYGNALVATRTPPASVETVRSATLEKLRQFHAEKYQAARMHLVAVGAVPADLSREIERRFGDLPRGTGPAAISLAPDRPAGPTARIIQIPRAPVASLALISTREIALESQSRDELLDALALRCFSRWLARLKTPPGISAPRAVAVDDADGLIKVHTLEITLSPDQLARGASFLATVVAQAKEPGGVDGELPQAIAEEIDRLRQTSREFARISNSRIAGVISARAALGLSWELPSQGLERDIALLQAETAASLRARLAQLFAEGNIVLVAKTPDDTPDAAAEIVTAYCAKPGASLEFENLAPFGYESFGPPVPPVITESAGRTDLDFPNGIRARVESGGAGNRFVLCARIGQGVRDLAPGEAGFDWLGYALLGASRLRQNSRDDVHQALKSRGIDARLSLDESPSRQLTFTMTGPDRELSFALRFLAAWQSDTLMEGENYPSALEVYRAWQQNWSTSPKFLAELKTAAALHGGADLLRLLPPDEAAAINYFQLANWVSRHWLKQPPEIAVLTSLNTNEVAQAMARSVGALAFDARQEPAPPLAAPVKGIQADTVKSSEPSAIVRVCWTSPPGTDSRALRCWLSILTDRIKQQLRTQDGMIYSLTFGLQERRSSGLPIALWTEIAADPKNAKRVLDRVLELGQTLATTGADHDTWGAAVRRIENEDQKNLSDQEWRVKSLLDALESATASSSRDPRATDEARKAFLAANAYGIAVLPEPPDESGRSR
jgi:zinc protease